MSAQGMTQTVLVTTLAAAIKADGGDEAAIKWEGAALREWIVGIAAQLSSPRVSFAPDFAFENTTGEDA